MEFLTFLAVLAVLIILLVNISSLNHRLNNLIREVELLRKSLHFENRNSEKQVSSSEPIIVKKPEVNVEAKPVIEAKKKTDLSEPVTSSYEDTVKAKLEAMDQPSASFQIASKKPISSASPKPSKPPTDLEKFVGENLISKIGIIILVLGVGFFVKYAIDQNWIGVYGRAAIGLIIGGALISVAHYLRKSFKTFSSLLTGGGLAVFYITIAIAFHQYHIFSQTVAFVVMVFITVFSVLLSLAYDKKELAIFAQLGGYAAPFMLSTGEGNYVVLFSYMLILNAGLLTLSYFKRWHVLNLLAFIFTIIIFSGWLANTFLGNSILPYLNAMLFASSFYIVFFLVNILNNIKERKPFRAVEIMMILTNNLFFFLWGIMILYSYEKGLYKGLFTVLIGLFNFGWVMFLYRRKQVDKNLIYLLIALVMSYISLSVPIQLNGHSITLFWTAELVLLLWLSQVSGIKILKTGHLVMLLLVMISLMMDWGNLYGQYNKIALPVIFNKAFITGVFVIAGLIVSTFLLGREKEETFVDHFISTSTYSNLLTFALFTASFLIPFLELMYQMSVHYPVNSIQVVVGSIYIYAYLFIVLLITQDSQWRKTFKCIFFISWATLFMYLIVFHPNVLAMRQSLIYGKLISNGNFLVHYLAIPFVVGMVFILLKRLPTVLPNTFFSQAFVWFMTFLLVFIASAELDNVIVLTSEVSRSAYDHLLQVSHKVGYPILWGVCAFILIALGIKFKNKIFRIQALCLFALIILKLFLFDVWGMSEGGRIAAFVFLGVVLLIVSFLYQKLKNLILDAKNINNEL